MIPSIPRIVVAPMAGGPSTPELVAGAVDAGAYGFLAAGYITPVALATQIAATRALTTKPFGVNVFVPGEKSSVDLTGYAEKLRSDYGIEPGGPAWTDDEYPAKIDVLAGDPVDTVSFTFGLPSVADVQRLRAVGSKIVITVTSPAEARLAAALRPDALCVQGFEAGAHRGIFTDDGSPSGAPTYGLLTALRLVGAAVDIPLIAAGGLVHGADIAAVLTAGAVAAQLGTAFLRCPEAGTQPLHRQALGENRETAVTRAFSGRPARALVNRFLTGNTDLAPAAYPQVNSMTKPIRAAAAQAGDPEAMSLYAGQAYSQAPQGPVAEVVARLDAQLRAAIRSACSALDPATP
ncbi:2-nitropropane dioxygenase [Actinosynnema sp. ALI-1.44]|uniref:nitronate monooxygenase n=1 Tax=Actinosynnema sp. ALI-1.44 TaxID=1933779 RepID=UPI00097C8407|nr:nitronate monooxygenase [Actinosynnema sp. ALI-1.44]ONI76952.1 2-nitropropane dioxygenase [Actinosynnema sp. ALI-1.44]